MQLGLQLPNFTWTGGAPALGGTLADIVCAAEAAGYASVWVMDHFFQIPLVGPVERDMLEAYTTLGYIAALTSRVRIGTMVSGVTYRHPGILVKQVTTLDVLSRGRAWFGIGAAWFEREHQGLGVPFPALKERYERLEETLQIALQMWSGNAGAFDGRYYRLAETLNAPQCLSKPHPPILIGGSGEKKTLKLVARYADACNLFGDPETVARKLAVLQEHCAREGRDYTAIEKTVLLPLSVGRDGSGGAAVVDQLAAYAERGIQTAIGALIGVEKITPIEVVGRDVIPHIAAL